jgi:signal peptidase
MMKNGWWVLVGLLVGVYLTINLALPRFPSLSAVANYLIQAGLWSLPALFTLRLPPGRPLSKIRIKKDILLAGLLIGFSQVMLYVIGGLFSGFGHSPSSFTPLGITLNLAYVGSMLFGMEISRGWLVTRFGKKHPSLSIAIATILFTIIGIPLAQFTGFEWKIQSLNTVGSNWLPLLMENLLASMLVLQAGPKASLVYRGLLAAFWWFCPILPNLDWGLKAVIGCVVPVVGMMMVNRLALVRGQSKRHQDENSFPLGWILTATVCMILVWFAVGLFPFKPSVIPTGSMVPVFNPGDIAIVAKVSSDNIKLGDIIEYRTETINIVHRVIKIEKDGYFITKGDANNTADTEPVDPRNVTGKVVFNVPKVGWISIAVKQLFAG